MHFFSTLALFILCPFYVFARPQGAEWGHMVDCSRNKDAMRARRGIGARALCEDKKRIVTEHDHPDPHQLYKFEQITDNINCGAQSPRSGIDDYCTITREDVTGTAKSVSFGLGADGGGALVSAGYEVTQYKESGSGKGCTTGAGARACVFYRTAHTMYGVSAQDVDDFCCNVGDKYDTVITAPNERHGHEYLCAKDEQCHYVGYSYWHNMEDENNGVTLSGGPQNWPTEWDERNITGLLPKLKEKESEDET